MTAQRKNEKRPIDILPKEDESLCWVPGCFKKGDHYELSYDADGCVCSADVMLCEKHQEEAAEAGQ